MAIAYVSFAHLENKKINIVYNFRSWIKLFFPSLKKWLLEDFSCFLLKNQAHLTYECLYLYYIWHR